MDKLEKVGALMEVEEEAEQGSDECEEVYWSPSLPRLSKEEWDRSVPIIISQHLLEV